MENRVNKLTVFDRAVMSLVDGEYELTLFSKTIESNDCLFGDNYKDLMKRTLQND